MHKMKHQTSRRKKKRKKGSTILGKLLQNPNPRLYIYSKDSRARIEKMSAFFSMHKIIRSLNSLLFF